MGKCGAAREGAAPHRASHPRTLLRPRYRCGSSISNGNTSAQPLLVLPCQLYRSIPCNLLVRPLPPPDSFYYDAAMGWLILGNPTEAIQELQRIQPHYQEVPDVLELDWMIRAQQSDWQGCLRCGEKLVQTAPDRPSGWIHRAYALRRIAGGNLQLAWDALLPAADLFPDEVIIPYNLACYACQLKNIPSARNWFERAMHIADRSGEKPHWIETALKDSDLELLWPEIRRVRE